MTGATTARHRLTVQNTKSNNQVGNERESHHQQSSTKTSDTENEINTNIGTNQKSVCLPFMVTFLLLVVIIFVVCYVRILTTEFTNWTPEKEVEIVLPNVLLMGEPEAVGTLGIYSLRAYSNVCGPRYNDEVIHTTSSSDEDEEQRFLGADKSERIPRTDQLSEWECVMNQNDNVTYHQLRQNYLWHYQHCSKDNDDNSSIIRIDATWSYVNVPNVVKRGYHLLGNGTRVPVKIIIVLPQFAIDQISSSSSAEQENDMNRDNDNNNINNNPFGNCIGNSNDFYKFGLVNRRESCKRLGTYWKKLFPGQVVFLPCEFIQSSPTKFQRWWQEELGLEPRKETGSSAKTTVLEPPFFDIGVASWHHPTNLSSLERWWEESFGMAEANNNKNHNKSMLSVPQFQPPLLIRENIWVGSYSNGTKEGDIATCVPHTKHWMRANLTRQFLSNVTTSTLAASTMTRTTQPPLSVSLTSQSNLLVAHWEDPIEIARSGYYYISVTEQQDGDLSKPFRHYFPVPSIYLEFRKTSHPGMYNINGTAVSILQRVIVRGILHDDSLKLTIITLEKNLL